MRTLGAIRIARTRSGAPVPPPCAAGLREFAARSRYDGEDEEGGEEHEVDAAFLESGAYGEGADGCCDREEDELRAF